MWGKPRIPSLPFDKQPTTKASSHEGSGLNSNSVDESLGRHLRNVLQLRMASLHDLSSTTHGRFQKIVNQSNKALPAPLACLFAYIEDQTRISNCSKSGKNTTETSFTTGYTQGYFKRNEIEFSKSCMKIGLECDQDENDKFFYKPCVEALEVDVYHLVDWTNDPHLKESYEASLPGCESMAAVQSNSARALRCESLTSCSVTVPK